MYRRHGGIRRRGPDVFAHARVRPVYQQLGKPLHLFPRRRVRTLCHPLFQPGGRAHAQSAAAVAVPAAAGGLLPSVSVRGKRARALPEDVPHDGAGVRPAEALLVSGDLLELSDPAVGHLPPRAGVLPRKPPPGGADAHLPGPELSGKPPERGFEPRRGRGPLLRGQVPSQPPVHALHRLQLQAVHHRRAAFKGQGSAPAFGRRDPRDRGTGGLPQRHALYPRLQGGGGPVAFTVPPRSSLSASGMGSASMSASVRRT